MYTKLVSKFLILRIVIEIYIVNSGVAVGAGLQSAVAVVNLVCFYLIGIPLGALLGYLTNLQVKVNKSNF